MNEMNRRSFLGLSLGAPVLAAIEIKGGLGLLATPVNKQLQLLQSLWHWSYRYPDRLLCIPKELFEPLWDHLHGTMQLYGNVEFAQEGWDHALFHGRPLLPYWSLDDLHHMSKEIHDFSGKWILAIKEDMKETV